MGIRIQQLPPAIANQIAAGEVIERPASVVKELLENSLDANASQIAIEVDYGGLNRIKISDNGLGIFAEDLLLAVAAHATSKITKLDDLYAIDSMGFRGEALASICSIAKVTITSRPEEQDTAMMLHVLGSEFSITPSARSIGTTIDVSDLFFNAPVRKRFLKNEKLEFQAIEMVVKRFALSAPNIALSLKHNKKQMLLLPAAVSEQARQTRMSRIFGSTFIKHAIYLDVEQAGMRLHGWISGPDMQRSQNDRQWVYINQRMVKDKLLNHALKQAYDGILHPGRFPVCLLYLTINTADVDVNVHPTKHEVRFQQPRLVHDFFTSQITKALDSLSADNQETVYEYSSSQEEHTLELAEPRSLALKDETHSFVSDYRTLSQTRVNPRSFHSFSGVTRKQKDNFESVAPWIILNDSYILIFMSMQPYLVNSVLLYHQWLRSQLITSEFPLQNRPLLVPVNFSLPLTLNDRKVELIESMSLIGIHIELVAEDKVLFRSVPVKAPYLDLRLFWDAIVESESLHVDQMISLLCESQVVNPHFLSIEEKSELNHWLFQTESLQQKELNICKVLTLDDCRMLLDV